MSKFKTRLNLSNQNFIQESGDTLNLSGNTRFFKAINIPAINHAANNFVVSGTSGSQRYYTGNGTNSVEALLTAAGQIRLRSVTNSFGTKSIDLIATGTSIVVRADGGSLRYSSNHSPNFTGRSIPDVIWITGNTLSSIVASNGLTGITTGGVKNIRLGGTLASDTVVNVDGNSLSLVDDDASIGFVVDGGTDELLISHSDLGSLSFSPTGAIFTDTRGTKRGIQYAGNYVSGFNAQSLVNLGYVTGLTSISITGATNGLTKVGRNVRLGGSLASDFTIDNGGLSDMNFSLQDGTFSIVLGDGVGGGGQFKIDNLDGGQYLYMGVEGISNLGALQYGGDYSSNYTKRSLVDKGYVTGLTSLLGGITGGTNGLQKITNRIGLGGTIDQYTLINGGGNDLDFAGLANFSIYGGTNLVLGSPGNQAGYIQMVGVSTIDIGTQGDQQSFTLFSGTGDPVGITLNNEDNAFLIYDNRTTATGIEYGADYSANYTPRSLVDANYVTTIVASGSTADNGLTKTAGNIQLGGPLIQDTIFTGAETFNLSIGQAGGEELSSFNIYTTGAYSEWTIGENGILAIYSTNVSPSDGGGYFQLYPYGINLGGGYANAARLELTNNGFLATASQGEASVSGSQVPVKLIGASPAAESTSLVLTPTNTTPTFVVDSTASGFKGLEYGQNFGSNYSSRSLIDKGYGDGRYVTITGGTAKFWKVGGTTNLTGNTSIVLNGFLNFSGGIKSFSAAAGYAALNIGGHTSNPTSPNNGDIYYNTGSNELRLYNGSWIALGSGGGGGTITGATNGLRLSGAGKRTALGGTVTGSTTINLGNNDFKLFNTAGPNIEFESDVLDLTYVGTGGTQGIYLYDNNVLIEATNVIVTNSKGIISDVADNLVVNDTLVTSNYVKNYAYTFTNKTHTSPIINTNITGNVTSGGNITPTNFLIGATANQTMSSKRIINSIITNTILSGSTTWNGSAILPAYGGTGLASLGTALQQLRVNGAGNALEYFTPSAGGGTVTGATNGLRMSGAGKLTALGGTLTGNTTITTSTGATLTFAGRPISYAANLSANYTLRSLVDKDYVTGVTSTLTTTGNNGITKSGQNFRLGGSLTGNTTITTATGSRLTIAGWPLMYATDLSGSYSVRSLVDRGYVTGVTSTLTTTANNGITKSGQNFRLGGILTGNTQISGNTGSRLTVAGWPVQYATNLSANFGPRSVVDKGYVTGITSTIATKSFPMGVGGAVAITAGEKGIYTIPYSGTIKGWRLVSKESTTMVLDVWKTNNAIPTIANTIFGTKPSLTATRLNSASGLNIAVTAGDVFILNVDSNSTSTYFRLDFEIQ